MDDHLDTPAERIDAGADVVPLRRGPEELIDDRYLLDALLENTPDNIYFKDWQSRFIRISTSLARWMGLNEAADAIGKSDFDFFGEDHAQKAFADEQRLMRSGEPIVGVEEQESWADGHTTWVSTTKGPLRDRNGAIVGIFGISRDITERKQAEQRVQEQATQLAEQAQMLERLASQDELTALYNRRGLAMVGEHMLYEARRTGTSLGVLFIDLDGLKTINDRFTHRAGDEALRTIGTIMLEATREADVSGANRRRRVLRARARRDRRIGQGAGRSHQQRHQRAQSQTADRFDISVSIGRVLFDARTSGSIDDLIERADTAMYDRKARRVS